MPTSLRLRSLLLAAALAGCTAPPGPGPAPHAEAVPSLEARLARDTLDPQAVLALAEAYRELGRLPEAAALLERGIRRDSAGAMLALLGLTYEQMERFGDARSAYEAYLARTPRSPVREKLRGRLLLVQRSEATAFARLLLARGPAASAEEGDRLAVMPFDYAGSDAELRPLGRAVSEMLMTDLSQTERLRLVERLRLQTLLDEQQLSESGRVDPETAARTGRLLGASRTLQGSLGGDSRQVLLQASVSSTSSPLREQDALKRLIEAEKRLAVEIYGALGIELTDAERARVLRRPTESLQALLAFGSGLEASDVGDFARATREFTRAAALDGRFAEARTRAADARAAAAAQAAGLSALGRQLSTGSSAGADLADLDKLLPSSSTRDVAAEALGGEGLGSRDAVLRIILPPRP